MGVHSAALARNAARSGERGISPPPQNLRGQDDNFHLQKSRASGQGCQGTCAWAREARAGVLFLFAKAPGGSASSGGGGLRLCCPLGSHTCAHHSPHPCLQPPAALSRDSSPPLPPGAELTSAPCGLPEAMTGLKSRFLSVTCFSAPILLKLSPNW